MAAERDPMTFDGVDWDRWEGGRGVGSVQLLEALAGLVLLGALCYDYVLVAPGEPTIAVGGAGGPGAEAAVVWDVSSVEWLFASVLLLGLFHIAVPLARNRRMTAYYWRQFRKNGLAVVSLGYLGLLFLVGVVGPIIWVAPNETIDYASAYAPPLGLGGGLSSPEHALGTDAQGRHIWHLIVYGIRVSFEVGLIATALAISIGTVVGAVAAYVGGYVDEILMRYVDLQQTFPVFILLLLIIYLYGASLLLIILLYGVFGWEGTARLVRSEALQRSEQVSGGGSLAAVDRASTHHPERLQYGHHGSDAVDPGVHPRRGDPVVSGVRGSEHVQLGPNDQCRAGGSGQRLVDQHHPRCVPLSDRAGVQLRRRCVA